MKESLNLPLPHLDDLVLAVYIKSIEWTVVKGKRNESIATSSALGWLITGEISMDEPPMVIHLTSAHFSKL